VLFDLPVPPELVTATASPTPSVVATALPTTGLREPGGGGPNELFAALAGVAVLAALAAALAMRRSPSG
jgi:hypothetical protein